MKVVKNKRMFGAKYLGRAYHCFIASNISCLSPKYESEAGEDSRTYLLSVQESSQGRSPGKEADSWDPAPHVCICVFV